MNINRVTISGNLTRDPETRTTAGGTTICSFSVAVNDRVKEGSEWKDRPNYVDCVAFSGLGDYLAKTISRGAKVAVAGKLRWSQWEKNGEKRSKLEVVAEDVEVLTAPKEQPVYTAPVAVYEEEIPF